MGAVEAAPVPVMAAPVPVVLVLVMANVRKPSIPQGLYVGLLVLTLANIAVAVFWSPVHA